MMKIEHKQEMNIVNKFILKERVLKNEKYINLISQNLYFQSGEYSSPPMLTSEDLCAICLEYRGTKKYSIFLPCYHHCC